MATQKLSSQEARVPSRLSENLLKEQGVSAPKSTGTTSRSRSTKPRLGHFLEQKLIPSGRKNPCACGRTKDGDCRSNDNTLFCHNSPLSDQFRWCGQTWFLHRANCGHTGAEKFPLTPLLQNCTLLHSLFLGHVGELLSPGFY